MDTATARIAELERVLKMAQYELITLNPRLTPQYQKSVRAVLDEIDKVIPRG